MSEYDCDSCGDLVPDGDGFYIGGDRVCSDCNNQQTEREKQ